MQLAAHRSPAVFLATKWRSVTHSGESDAGQSTNGISTNLLFLLMGFEYFFKEKAVFVKDC